MSDNYCLPRDVVPVEYLLYLNLSMNKETFRGAVIIATEVNKITDKIIMHGVELKILQATIQVDDQVYLTQVQYDPKKEIIILLPNHPLPVGTILIRLVYEGRVRDDLKGLYKSDYVDSQHNKNFILSTQFESTYARMMLPCWDEPGVKSIFRLTLEIDPGLDAFSNTPIQQITERKGRTLVSFEPTPRMSVYTLALAVGEYEKVKSSKRNLSIIVPPERTQDTKLALYTAVKAITHYEDILGISYPLAKLDLIMVPQTGSGAMENFGLLTFSPSALLTSPHSSSFDIYYVADTISHELAHQFFGNLCTMREWTSVWLNEGIATYFEYHGLNAAFPSWKVWYNFPNRAQQEGLDMDFLASSHPLNAGKNVSSAEMFDQLTYDKGGAVLRMIAHYLGDDLLFAGLHDYLQACSFGNSTPALLWSSLDKVSPDVKLSEVMPTWTDQAGFPLIIVEERPGGIILHQEAYCPFEHPDNKRWWIPTTILCSDGNEIRIDFNTVQSEFIHLPAGWYKVNYHQATYARVKYPDHVWKQFVGIDLPVQDRAGLLNDLLTLSIDDYVPLEVALEVTYYMLLNEKEAGVWSSVIGSLYRISSIFYDQKQEKSFDLYMIKLMNQVMTWLWNPVSWGQKMIQGELLSMAVYFDQEMALETARMFKAWVEDPTTLSPDLQTTIFQQSVLDFGSVAWQVLYDRYMEETDILLKQRYLIGMANTKEKDLLMRVLKMSLDPEVVRLEDRVSVVLYVSGNPYGRSIAWNFIKDNWSVFNSPGQQIRNLIEDSVWNFHTQEQYEDVKNFFSTNQNVAPVDAVLALDRIRYNMKWRSAKINLARLENFVRKNV
ncbi:MAG: M1 family metallopeptidase [Nitrososphaerales archaeon]